MTSIADVLWETTQLGPLVTALARRAGLVLAETGGGHDTGSPEAVCAARGLAGAGGPASCAVAWTRASCWPGWGCSPPAYRCVC